VLQGEREFAADNRTLGRFNLTGIPPAPRGVPQIEVSFDIDANGILNVSAKDLATGKEQSIEIKGSSGLKPEEIERMRKEAEAHAEEDKKRRELVDLKNQADELAYRMERLLNEQGEKVPAQDRSNIESAISQLRETLKGDDRQAIQRAMTNLQQAAHRVSAELYEAAARKAGSGAQTTPPPEDKKDQGKGDEDVIDAEYDVDQ